MEQVIYRDACYADTQVCYGDPQERLFSGEIKEFKGRTSKAARGQLETSTRQIKPPHVPSQLFNETLGSAVCTSPNKHPSTIFFLAKHEEIYPDGNN